MLYNCTPVASKERLVKLRTAWKREESMETNENIRKFLAEKIKAIGLLPDEVPCESYDEDFLVGGMIDSFGFVALITAVEESFSLEITETDQLDERIRTINGFSAIICERLV